MKVLLFYLLCRSTSIDQPQKSCSTRSKSSKNALLSEKLLYEAILPMSAFIFLIEVQSFNDKKVKEIINDIVFEGTYYMMTRKIGEIKDEDSDESEENCVCGEIIKGSKELENGETLGDHVEHVLNCGCVDPKIDSESESKFFADEDDGSNDKQESDISIITEERLESELQSVTNQDDQNPKSHLGTKTTTKTEVLDVLNLFSNFSLKIDIQNKKLKEALEKRNKIFESDESQISKGLCLDELKKMKAQVSIIAENRLKRVLNIKKVDKTNKKYTRVIKTLRRTITETENLAKALDREKSEFVREFMVKKKIPESKKLHETKITFNLAGSIFAPNVFLQMIKDINMVDKDEFIEKNVNKLLKPIEALELYIKHRSNTEKKEEIIKFLLACLEKRNTLFFESIDEAFKMRSNIIGLYFTNELGQTRDKKISVIDQFQEQYIKNILRTIKETNEDVLDKFIVLNSSIESAYVDFLRTDSKDKKKKLYELF